MGDPDDGTEPGGRVGLLVGDRYRLTRRLGSGGFGRVWLARDEQLSVDVAVKEVWLPPAISAREQAERVTRAQREARSAARLRGHPNIVTVYDVVVENGVPWTVMQFITGVSLADHLAVHSRLTVAQTARVAAAMLSALGAAHAAGIVHRDVKPANIMLTDDGGAILTDFGIAVQETDTALTATGSFIGSVEYIAPERARGGASGPESDLFSLGATLYQAVEGFSPFQRGSVAGSLGAVLFEEAPAPALAGALTPVILGLLVKDPATRLTSAAAYEQVAAAAAGLGIGRSGAPARPTAAYEPTATAYTLPVTAEDSGTAHAEDAVLAPDRQDRQNRPARPRTRLPRPKRSVAAAAGILIAVAVGLGLYLGLPGSSTSTISESQLADDCSSFYQGQMTADQCQQIAQCYAPRVGGVSAAQFAAVAHYNLDGSGVQPPGYATVENAKNECDTRLPELSAFVDGVAGDT
jgi:eukaryotic-like serine/threonine-protein kinase